MHALAMIDRAIQSSEIVPTAKPGEQSGQHFGKVLNEKQQAQPVQEEKQTQLKAEVNQKDKPEVQASKAQSQDQAIELKGQAVELKGQAAEVRVQAVELKVQSHEQIAQQMSLHEMSVTGNLQSQEQQALVDLIKVVVQKKSTDMSEDELNLKLDNLVQQLDSIESQGEQALAGIDVSALVAELDSFSSTDAGEEQLTQLVAELEAQITSEAGQLKSAEMGVVAAPGAEQVAQQLTATTLKTETLIQTRKMLQSAIAVATTKNNVVSEDPVSEEPVNSGLFTAGEGGEEIDPRFSRLLQGRMDNDPLQSSKLLKEQLQQLDPKQPGVEQKSAEPAAQSFSGEQVASRQDVVGQQQNTTVKQMIDNLSQQSQRNLNPLGQQIVPGMQSNHQNLPTPMVQLTNAVQMPESQIFDQVVTQISGSVNGESGRMVLRLQPAELGSLRLELMVEGDRVRANLHAQSLQVQEVIERNLPQLRNALAEQGLKIDQFQINVDQRQQGGQFENLAQQQHNQGSSHQPSWNQDLEQEEQMIPLAHLMQNGGGGISLHV